MLLVDFTKQEQSSIRGDMTTGKIGFNLAAREWRESGEKVSFLGTILDSGCWFSGDGVRS